MALTPEELQSKPDAANNSNPETAVKALLNAKGNEKDSKREAARTTKGEAENAAQEAKQDAEKELKKPVAGDDIKKEESKKPVPTLFTASISVSYSRKFSLIRQSTPRLRLP